MLCLSGFELYSHWVPLLCIRGGRGKRGRKGRRQEKLSNNAKYSKIQEGLKGENHEKNGREPGIYANYGREEVCTLYPHP